MQERLSFYDCVIHKPNRVVCVATYKEDAHATRVTCTDMIGGSTDGFDGVCRISVCTRKKIGFPKILHVPKTLLYLHSHVTRSRSSWFFAPAQRKTNTARGDCEIPKSPVHTLRGYGLITVEQSFEAMCPR